jgi:hypothetical protein
MTCAVPRGCRGYGHSIFIGWFVCSVVLPRITWNRGIRIKFMSVDPDKSEQQRDIEQAGVSPELAGYDDVDLSQHINPSELASNTASVEPDAVTKFKLRQKKLAHVRAIYNKIEVKDMTFEQFAKEYLELMDPQKMQRDLASIKMMKDTEKANRNRINTAIKMN